MTGFVPVEATKIIEKNKRFVGKTDSREASVDKYTKRRLELVAKKKAERAAKLAASEEK